MPFMGKFLAIAMLSLAFTASAGAQAPQVEKNVSMKMALMIIADGRSDVASLINDDDGNFIAIFCALLERAFNTSTPASLPASG